MEQVRLCRLEDWEETKNLELPYVIVAKPCECLFKLQETGYLVLAELSHLRGLSQEETAEALSKEEAVWQYRNVCIDAEKLSKAYFQRIWQQFKGQPVVIGETKHLLIRESIEEDAEAFFRLYQDRLCRRYLEKPMVSEESAEGYRRYIEEYRKGQYAFYEYGMWSVVEKSSGSVVGRMGLENLYVKAEGTAQEDMEAVSLGYALLPEFRGKGYAVEACREIFKYCSECEYAEVVYVKISEENEASKGVYQKLLFSAASSGITLICLQ